MKRIKPSDRIEQWTILSSRDVLTDNQATHTTNNQDAYDHHSPDNDPFDCSDLIVPNTSKIIKNILKDKVKEWEELDSRIIVPDPDDDDDVDEEEEEVAEDTSDKTSVSDDASDNDGKILSKMPPLEGNISKETNDNNVQDRKKPRQHFHLNNIRLPYHFDYKCENPPPPEHEISILEPIQDKKLKKRKRVISLQDPTKTLDYERQLWNIFDSVPLESEIESEIRDGSFCQNLNELQNEISQGIADFTRIDGHALGRLRKRETHHFPRLLSQRDENDTRTTCNYPIHGATVRLEAWKRHLKRGSSACPNRCELEFLTTQTLYDIHSTLVYLANDDLFVRGKVLDRIRQGHEAGEDGTNGGDDNVENNDDGRNVEKLTNDGGLIQRFNYAADSSGFFFIEDTFYITGDVDYVSPILEWLDGEGGAENDGQHAARSAPNTTQGKKRGRKKKLKSRREYLGIPPGIKLNIMNMKDVKIESISFRLGVRYIHVFHGDCELALLFSDIGMRLQNELLPGSHYPIVHDTWSSFSTISPISIINTCQGCNTNPSEVVTIEDELTDGGPTYLCKPCYIKLHYTSNGAELKYNNYKVVPISALDNLRELSVGNDFKFASF